MTRGQLGERILSNAAEIQDRIGRAAGRSGRSESEVTLVAVTKTLPLEVCAAAAEAGLIDLGENYIKELREKAPALPDVRWHYLGPVQSHTANAVADHSAFVHGLSSANAAARLSRRATARGARLAVLVQVDFTGSRSGVAPDDLQEFLDVLVGLEGLEVRGLMTLPPVTPDAEGARPYFVRLRRLLEDARGTYPGLRELSMGMSLDYEVAVEEGATMVRVGTALFGERNKR